MLRCVARGNVSRGNDAGKMQFVAIFCIVLHCAAVSCSVSRAVVFAAACKDAGVPCKPRSFEIMLWRQSFEIMLWRQKIICFLVILEYLSPIAGERYKGIQVSFAEYCLFYRALLQKRPMIARSLSSLCKMKGMGWLRLVSSLKFKVFSPFIDGIPFTFIYK